MYHRNDVARFFHIGNHAVSNSTDAMQSTTMRLINTTKNFIRRKPLSRLISALMPIPTGSSANISLPERLPHTNTIN